MKQTKPNRKPFCSLDIHDASFLNHPVRPASMEIDFSAPLVWVYTPNGVRFIAEGLLFMDDELRTFS
jgi:hypothetical protein